MSAREITERIRALADDAHAAAAEQIDARFMTITYPLGQALREAADLLDEHQDRLTELRNRKADA